MIQYVFLFLNTSVTLISMYNKAHLQTELSVNLFQIHSVRFPAGPLLLDFLLLLLVRLLLLLLHYLLHHFHILLLRLNSLVLFHSLILSLNLYSLLFLYFLYYLLLLLPSSFTGDTVVALASCLAWDAGSCVLGFVGGGRY